MNQNNPTAYINELLKLDKSTLPADGGERYNRFIFARSPYLLQHAENPVKWHEWGETAFDTARAENKPVLLSIGYATCHWCHVMAHESFNDAEVAELLNSHFICIKVDREERPDIDDYYMAAAQLLTGSGGWPLNVFLTPDREPFFAMTYLPKRGRSGMGGFMELLSRIVAFWQQKPDEIRQSSAGIMEMLDGIAREADTGGAELDMLNALAMERLSSIYDQQNGGFGSAPKFPMAIYLGWLLEYGASVDAAALKMAINTLRKIRNGGIWDHLGGGVHRYAVDGCWLVPHFEKMLYDQAMLSMAAIEAYQSSGELEFMEMADSIFSFVSSELTSDEGGFYSALDADSEGEEGRFYVWEEAEVKELLKDDAGIFCGFYGVTAAGNFEGRSILNVTDELPEFAARNGMNEVSLKGVLDRCRGELLKHRNRRIRPLRDEKVIAAWNGLMIAALARGGIVFGRKSYLQRAAAGADFVLGSMRRADGRLMRSYMYSSASVVPAFLEDYACLCNGLLELYEATLEVHWLDEATRMAEEMVRHFGNADGLFTRIGHDAEQMPGKMPQDHDGVTPSAFSTAAHCLVRIGQVTGRDELLDYAHALLAPLLAEAKRNPLSQLVALRVQSMLENEPVRVEFVGELGSVSCLEMLQMIRQLPFPNLVITARSIVNSPPAVSICAGHRCYPPVTDMDELVTLLELLI